MSRRPDVNEEERVLWARVTRAIKPLRPSALQPKSRPKAEAQPPPPPPPRPQPVSRVTAKPPALAPLDRKLRQRLARGRDSIDARIDLHGMTQHEAHAALLAFIRKAQARDARIALVVTGKGTPGSERGVLRRQVPLWLALPEFRPFIVGFEEAHLRHGGEGALYLRLRRAP